MRSSIKGDDDTYKVSSQKNSSSRSFTTRANGFYLVESDEKLSVRDLQLSGTKIYRQWSWVINFDGKGYLSRWCMGLIENNSSLVLARLLKGHFRKQKIAEDISWNPRSQLRSSAYVSGLLPQSVRYRVSERVGEILNDHVSIFWKTLAKKSVESSVRFRDMTVLVSTKNTNGVQRDALETSKDFC